jgi:mRNA-degrading endonuclease RelE of RelBE toxin-antitoxin system
MKIQTTPHFDRSVKKLFPQEKKSLDDTIRALLNNPMAGEGKKGDLSGVRVYKYKHLQDLFLLAYSIDTQNDQIILLGHGTHENFYRDLKNK